MCQMSLTFNNVMFFSCQRLMFHKQNELSKKKMPFDKSNVSAYFFIIEFIKLDGKIRCLARPLILTFLLQPIICSRRQFQILLFFFLKK